MMRLAWIIAASALLLSTGATASPMPICGTGKRITCVVDGDTFWLRGTKYRIADIDAPEVDHARCRAERERGLQATRRLADLLGQGQFAIERVGTDRYGRALANVSRGGRSIGAQLVREGLARRWNGPRRNWCARGV